MRGEQIIITNASIADATLLTQLSVDTFTQAFAADNNPADMEKYLAEQMNEAKINEELADAENIFFVARQGSKLVGYAKLGFRMKTEAKDLPHPVELERIYVRQEYYGTKTGAALMAACINEVKMRGYQTIWLGVWEHNHHAVAFYKRWGFELYGSHQFILGDDVQTDQLMKRTL